MSSVPNKGFTLLELLLVIAIIGILAAFSLAALQPSRIKGSDSAVKSNLTTVRSKAELFFYDNSNSYAGGTGVVPISTCPASAGVNSGGNYSMINDPNVFAALTQAITQSGAAAATSCRYITTSAAWAVAVQLRSGGVAGDVKPDSWCVDSNGSAKSYTWAAGQVITQSINGTACQ